jgi:hypothetical protein
MTMVNWRPRRKCYIRRCCECLAWCGLHSTTMLQLEGSHWQNYLDTYSLRQIICRCQRRRYTGDLVELNSLDFVVLIVGNQRKNNIRTAECLYWCGLQYTYLYYLIHTIHTYIHRLLKSLPFLWLCRRRVKSTLYGTLVVLSWPVFWSQNLRVSLSLPQFLSPVPVFLHKVLIELL